MNFEIRAPIAVEFIPPHGNTSSEYDEVYRAASFLSAREALPLVFPDNQRARRAATSLLKRGRKLGFTVVRRGRELYIYHQHQDVM